MAKQNIQKAIQDLKDTIVGKVPLPSDQVDQITLALLYKFMDDMDQLGMQMGGVATFFSGDYEKYSWTKIMGKSNSSQQRYNLYSEGLEKFYGNANLPETFRSIFKDANIPYRDPETLTNFLKIIDENFDYNEDSEQLGDAYEFLLNSLGSAGDLGMFRTPRHIIDFIVSLVEPSKDDRILDPACGTAGFLISAYKYILNNNIDENGKSNLTFDEKNKLLRNITGYDIAPSMVKISEMNMFLHGAAEPKIYEYDTLTYDDRWGDKFETILANPPFMTPKGGIVPHNRFSIKAKNSEILFVDYIANHISSQGKAGIIVPDGVVFKKEKPFVSVRKDIVENSLWGVISMPGGIFNPYASVQTCILLLDKNISKTRDKILFAELQYDGYTLSKQRKENGISDIPDLINKIINYKKNNELQDSDKVFLVNKNIIKENDYSLSIKLYKDDDDDPYEFEDIDTIKKRIIDNNKKCNELISKMFNRG